MLYTCIDARFLIFSSFKYGTTWPQGHSVVMLACHVSHARHVRRLI